MTPGGGAGGSIWVICSNAVGHGELVSVGGQGHSRGGGGAGGRISVKCSDLIKFNVSMHGHGGECYMSLFECLDTALALL